MSFFSLFFPVVKKYNVHANILKLQRFSQIKRVEKRSEFTVN